MHDPVTGRKYPGVSTRHTKDCCRAEASFSEATFCCGGHNAHAALRWADDQTRAATMTAEELCAREEAEEGGVEVIATTLAQVCLD